jgi:hypothetical protein
VRKINDWRLNTYLIFISACCTIITRKKLEGLILYCTAFNLPLLTSVNSLSSICCIVLKFPWLTKMGPENK